MAYQTPLASIVGGSVVLTSSRVVLTAHNEASSLTSHPLADFPRNASSIMDAGMCTAVSPPWSFRNRFDEIFQLVVFGDGTATSSAVRNWN